MGDRALVVCFWIVYTLREREGIMSLVQEISFCDGAVGRVVCGSVLISRNIISRNIASKSLSTETSTTKAPSTSFQLFTFNYIACWGYMF